MGDPEPSSSESFSFPLAGFLTFIAAAMLEGYTGDISVGDPNVPEVAEGAVGEACGDPNVAWSKGDGSGSFLNVNGAGRFFSILLISLSFDSGDAPAPSTSAGVVDSARRDGSFPFDSFRSRPLLVDSRLVRWLGMGGASDPDAIVCIEPFEKRDIFEAIENRE